MNRKQKDLPLLESETVEFKVRPNNLEKEIVAFANAKGGTIYIGLDDHGNKHPLQLSNRERSQIINSIKNCDPLPEFELKEQDEIVKLIVPEGGNKPYRAPDGFYLRLGATSQKLTRDQILQFAIRENRLQFDSQIYAWLSALETSNLFDREAFERFRELSGIDKSISNENLLENMNLVKRKDGLLGLTSAAVMLFSSKPDKIFPQLRSICWLMKDPVQILKQTIISGNLFEQLEQIMNFLESFLEKKFVIDSLKRSEIPEIPTPVLRELVINALIHRDYFEQGSEVQIKLFPDHIQVANPCALPSNLSINHLFGKSIRRNPLLAEAFQRIGYIERAGTGLLRVNALLTESHLPKINIALEGPFFIVNVSRIKQELQNQNISDAEERIVQLLKGRTLNTTELSKRLKISDRAVRLSLANLKKLGIVQQLKKGRRVLYVLREDS